MLLIARLRCGCSPSGPVPFSETWQERLSFFLSLPPSAFTPPSLRAVKKKKTGCGQKHMPALLPYIINRARHEDIDGLNI
ncbi:uncharacterized [Tachysurus ichikawai]